MSAGTQYAERSTVPPRQVPFPLDATEAGVEFAVTFVLPQYMCRYDARGWPGLAIGSSLFMCEYRHTVRKMPLPSTVDVGSSPVRTTRAAGDPGEPAGIFAASYASPGGRLALGEDSYDTCGSGAPEAVAATEAALAAGAGRLRSGPPCAEGRSAAVAVPTERTATTAATATRWRRRRRTRPATRVQRSVGGSASGAASTSNRRSSSLLIAPLRFAPRPDEAH